MTLRLIARPSGILVPRDDFGLKDIPARDLVLGDDIGFVAALLLGNDGNQSRLLKVDANGNLRVTTAGGAAISFVRLSNAAVSSVADPLDLRTTNLNGFAGLPVIVAMSNDGVSALPLGNAGGLGVAALSGNRAALAAPPGEWGVNSNPAAGAQAIATRAAGAAGVRHVARSVSFGFSSSAALGGVTTVAFQLTDGGVNILVWTFDLPAAIIVPFAVAFTGLNYVGGAAQAMTVQSDAAHAGLRVFANLTGFDAG